MLGYEKEKMSVQVCRRPTSLSRLCCLTVVGILSFALVVLLGHRMAGVEVPYVPFIGSLTLCLSCLVRLYMHAKWLEQAIAQQRQGLAAAAGENAPAPETQPSSEASYRLLFDNNPSPCGSTIVIPSRFLPSMTPPYTTMATPEQNFWV